MTKRDRISTLTMIAEMLPLGVILTDLRGRIVFANQHANAVLARRDGLSVGHGGELRAGVPAETSTLRRLLVAADAESDGAIRISRSSCAPLPLLVCPLADGHAAIFLGDHDFPLQMAQEAIRRWYGLTCTEARLAAALAEGSSLEEAADAMGIKPNTARTHLKRIFAKTGTNRQGALVRLLLTGPAVLRRTV